MKVDERLDKLDYEMKRGSSLVEWTSGVSWWISGAAYWFGKVELWVTRWNELVD